MIRGPGRHVQTRGNEMPSVTATMIKTRRTAWRPSGNDSDTTVGRPMETSADWRIYANGRMRSHCCVGDKRKKCDAHAGRRITSSSSRACDVDQHRQSCRTLRSKAHDQHNQQGQGGQQGGHRDDRPTTQAREPKTGPGQQPLRNDNDPMAIRNVAREPAIHDSQFVNREFREGDACFPSFFATLAFDLTDAHGNIGDAGDSHCVAVCSGARRVTRHAIRAAVPSFVDVASRWRRSANHEHGSLLGRGPSAFRCRAEGSRCASPVRGLRIRSQPLDWPQR